MNLNALKAILIGLSLLLLTNCKAIDNIAHGVLYPWKSVNDRMEKRGSKQPPNSVEVVSLSNGTNAFVSIKDDDRPAVVYLHGNGESVVDLSDTGFIAWLAARASFIAPDYPGAGIGGTGEANEKSLVETALLARNELLRRVKPETKVIVWGRSLGAAVAAQTAFRSKDQIHGLVLISPWTSLKDTLNTNWLGRFVSDSFIDKNAYLTDEACKFVDVPVFIVHGEKDTLIPYDHSERLTSCFKQNKFYPVKDFGHNDIYGGDVLNMITLFLNGF